MNTSSMTKKQNFKNILICSIGGLFVGFANGFFGGGGGMIVVPILVFLLGLEDKKAHATALFVIFPISLVSSIIYLLKNEINLMQLFYCGIGFVLSGIIGAFLLNKINNKVLRIIFSIVMVVAGIKMLI